MEIPNLPQVTTRSVKKDTILSSQKRGDAIAIYATIGELTTSWGAVEYGVTTLLALLMRMDVKKALIMIGNMSVDQRMNKVIQLGECDGLDSKPYKQMRKLLKRPTFTRNVVCHNRFVGTCKEEKLRLYFNSPKIETAKSESGTFYTITLPEIDVTSKSLFLFHNMMMEIAGETLRSVYDSMPDDLKSQIDPDLL